MCVVVLRVAVVVVVIGDVGGGVVVFACMFGCLCVCV